MADCAYAGIQVELVVNWCGDKMVLQIEGILSERVMDVCRTHPSM